ncbi:MAG: Ig-like domain-containing protein [Aeromonas sp.]
MTTTDNITWTGTFTADPDFDGNASVTVPAGSYTDLAGNAGTEGKDTVDTDTVAPSVVVDILDSSLNEGDTTSDVTFTFSEEVKGFDGSDLVVEGGKVTNLTTTDKIHWTGTFTADPDFDGDASVTVPAGSYTDLAGNVGTEGKDTVDTDTVAPSVVVDIADSSLNEGDTTSDVTFTFSEEVKGFDGTDLVVEGGKVTNLTTTDNIHWTGTFTADPDFDGNASVTVPAGSYTDLVGNAGTEGKDTVDTDTIAPTLAIVLDPNITADDIINAAEAGQQIPVSGTVGGDFKVGDTVTLTVNNKQFTGTVQGTDGRFTINVPGSDLVADSDHIIDASVTSTDAAGNSNTATDTEGYGVDVTPPVCLAIELDPNITPDDIINAAEKGQIIPVTGQVSGEYKMGDTVTLTINGKTFTGPVTQEGKFSINVPGSDLAADPDKTIDASVTSTDAAGNSMTAVDTEDYGVDTTINLKIELDADITPDDLISAAEKNQNIPVSGTVSGEFNVGDTVTLTVNNKEFTGKVLGEDGRFTIDVAGSDLVADSDKTIGASVTSTNAVGNSMTAVDTEGYGVDQIAPPAPTVTILDDVNNDGYISQSEAGDYNEWDPSKPDDNQTQISVKINAADFAAGGFVTIDMDQPSNAKTVNVWLEPDGTLNTDDGLARYWNYDATTGTITYTQTATEDNEKLILSATQTDAAGNQSIEASDTAILKLPEGWSFELYPAYRVASMDFTDVDVSKGNGTAEWSSDVAIKDIGGTGVWGEWGASNNGLIDVGQADIYGNAPYDDPTGNVAELGGNGAASTIYVDMDCNSDQNMHLSFDQGSSEDADLSNCNVKVVLVKLDVNGNPIVGSEVTLSDSTHQYNGWTQVGKDFRVDESGQYRMIFETDPDTDGHGPLLDNILVTATPDIPYNTGVVGTKIHVVPIDVKCPSGETGTIKMSGFPAGTVVTDGTHTVTTIDGQPIDVTNWNLASLALTTTTVGNFSINFELTAIEPITGEAAVLKQSISVNVSAPTTVDNDVVTDNTAQHDDSVLSVASDDHHPKTEHVSTADHASDPVVDVAHTANTVDPVNTVEPVNTVDTGNTVETTNTVHAELGNHILCGTEGADLFVWSKPEHAVGTVTKDIVNDFNHNQGDKLDLSALLDNNGTQSHDDMKGLLSVFEKDDGVHLEVKDADTHSVTQEIVLADHSFDSLTGGMGSTATQVVDYMLNNHMLELHK